MPLISIITITYNAASTLGPTMQSVKAQRFADYEHLVIDGASTDSTLAVARMQGSEKVRILSEPDGGLYDAMNKGLHMAKGRYVLFLNAGDRFASADTLGLYANASAHSPAIIYGDTDLVNLHGQYVGPRHLSAPAVLNKDSFRAGMLVCHQAFMVRRDLAPDYDLSYRLSSDYDWCLRCLEQAERKGQECVNLNRVTIHYLSEGLTTSHRFASLRERFSIMSRHFGLLPTAARHIGFLFRAVRRKL